VRMYVPDIIIQIDDGNGLDDLLKVIAEVKGYRHEHVKLKSATARDQWVPGVNNIGVYGRWDFIEFNDVHKFDQEFNQYINRILCRSKNKKRRSESTI